MMNNKLKSLSSVPLRRYLASHAAKPVSKSGNEVRTTTLPSGVILASVQSDSPLARVGVVIRAGARFEPKNQLGLTHTLRSAAGMTTKNHTGFGITRNIEYFGGRLSVAGSRDTISYLLEMHNDEDIIARNVSMLGETITAPQFKHWELSDNIERINADLSILEDTPYIQLAEALHAVAFKGGLRKSLYTPKFMVGKHTTEALQQYVKERFVGPNTAIVGVGLEHDELVQLVGKHFGLQSHQPSKCQCKFIGGEVHIDSSLPLTYVALATEGAGLKSGKNAIALQLFQTILGSGTQIKNAYGISQVTRLGRALPQAPGVAAAAFNLSYEDTGLFGINLIVPNDQDVTMLLKTAIKEFRNAAASVNETELNEAKKNLKTSILIASDTGDSLATEIGSQLLLRGGDLNDLTSQIDTISLADLKQIAQKLLKSKLALATIGSNAPYLDDLIE